jgi:hypothetical protein
LDPPAGVLELDHRGTPVALLELLAGLVVVALGVLVAGSRLGRVCDGGGGGDQEQRGAGAQQREAEPARRDVNGHGDAFML